MHPFEFYKLFLNVKTHFKGLNFIYGENTLSNVKVSSFENNTYYTSFLKVQKKLKDPLEVFVSNLLKKPELSIPQFLSYDVQREHKDWLGRIKNIDKLLIQDLEEIIFPDIKNFKELKIKLFSEPVRDKVTKTNDMFSIIDDGFHTEEPFILDEWIQDCYPETITVLDEIFFQKYGISFLKKIAKPKFKPHEHFIRLHKYRFFLDWDNILDYSVINKIMKDI